MKNWTIFAVVALVPLAIRDERSKADVPEPLIKPAAITKQAQSTASTQAARVNAKARSLPPNPRVVPQDRMSTFTIPATGKIEPIEIGLAEGVVTELRFQYPLKVDHLTGSLWMWRAVSRETLSITPPPPRLPGGRSATNEWGAAGDATITLKDGRTLVLAAVWAPLTYDLVVKIQLPPTCISPAQYPGCEAERQQVAQLTASNASLAHAVEEIARHSAAHELLAEQVGQDAALADEPIGGAVEAASRFMIPALPFKWQKPPPCDAAADQEAINGGCWVSTGRSAPCHSKTFEHGGKCFVPVTKAAQTPPQSEFK